jgi:long-chain acyl-CoA synthetase
MKITPTGALTHQAQTRPQSVAFVFHEEVWTYERLAAEAERLACGLADPFSARAAATLWPG